MPTSSTPPIISQFHPQNSPQRQPNGSPVHLAASAGLTTNSDAISNITLPLHRQRSSSPHAKRRRQASAAIRKRLKHRFRVPFPCFLIICFILAVFFSQSSSLAPTILSRRKPPDFTGHVNLFRGTENGGRMFPGVVAAPFAVVKFGPDCQQDPATEAHAGYLPTGNVTGFSMLHELGTDSEPKYGVVSQMPVIGSVKNPLLNISSARMGDDYAEVGYYRSWLQGGILTELAGTEHAGLINYSFMAGGFENSVVVDVSHVLQSFHSPESGQSYAQGKFHLFDDGHYEGFGVYNGGWNLAPNFTIYFCGYFDTAPHSAETFSGTGKRLRQRGKINITTGTERQGGVFTFRNSSVVSRIGVSWISSSKACKFVGDEIPKGTTIPQLVQKSKDRWNAEVLSKITTNTDANVDHMKQLYSNLYAMYIMPTNRTGENPMWESTEPYFDGIDASDQFRTTMPLARILTPEAHEQQLRSLLDIYEHEGWLPNKRSSDWTGETQGGSNVDNIFADAYVKDVKLNWTTAYQAVLKNAVTKPPIGEDPRASRFGRAALSDWTKYGFVTPSFPRAVSTAIEYAANDFAIYQMAKGLEQPENQVAFFLQRSRLWRNHWNAKPSSQGFEGFLAPRYASGEFLEPYNPMQCGECSWNDPFYKALPWEYTFAAGHHDMAAVVAFTGGEVKFIRKLQKIFEQWIYEPNSAYNSSIINPSHMESFVTPYLFHYVNRQDLSVKYSRRMVQFFYGPGNNGLPGNTHTGAMQSYQIWNMIGLYPVVGQRTFLIGSPWFKQMTINLAGRRKLHITMHGGNVKWEEFYVRSVQINGVYWNQNWLDYGHVFEYGGTIHFELSHTPVVWTAAPPPPSPVTEEGV